MIPPGNQPLQIKPRHHTRVTTPEPPRPPPSVSPHPWQDEGMRSARARARCRPLGSGSHFIRCQMCGNSSYHGKPPPQQQIQITPKKEESLITRRTLFHEKQNSFGVRTTFRSTLQFSSSACITSSPSWWCTHCLSLRLRRWCLTGKSTGILWKHWKFLSWGGRDPQEAITGPSPLWAAT